MLQMLELMIILLILNLYKDSESNKTAKLLSLMQKGFIIN